MNLDWLIDGFKLAVRSRPVEHQGRNRVNKRTDWSNKLGHTEYHNAMKILIPILVAIALNTTIAHCDDVHLVETAMYGDGLVPRGQPATNSIYVLLLPLHGNGAVHVNPVVLRTFEAKEIGNILEGAIKLGYLPKGSILHIDPSPVMKFPPEDQVKALKEHCKDIGMTVEVSGTA